MAFEGALTAPGSVAIQGLGAQKVLGQNVGLRVQKAGRRGAQLIPGDSCRLSLIPGSTGATGAGRGGTRGREGPFPRPVLLCSGGPAAWWSPQFLVCSLAGPAGSSGDPAFRGRGEGRSQARQGGHSLGGSDGPSISGTRSGSSVGVGRSESPHRGLGVQPCNASSAWASLVGGGRPGDASRTRHPSAAPSPDASCRSAVLSPPLPPPTSPSTPSGDRRTQPTPRGRTPLPLLFVFTDAGRGSSAGPGGPRLRASPCAEGPHKATGPQGSAASPVWLRTGKGPV